MSFAEFEPILVTTTSDDKTVLEKIASSLVDDRLAACVQISGPIKSYYRWQGNVESSEEWRCVVKSSRSMYQKLESEIVRMHNYDVPQLVVTDIAAGLDSYFSWMQSNINETGEDE